MKVTVKYKDLQVDFEAADGWKGKAMELLSELKEAYNDNTEYEKF